MRRLAFRLAILAISLLQAPFVAAIATGGEPPATISVTTPDANGNYVVTWTPPYSIPGLYQYRLEEQKDGGAWLSILYNSPFLSHSINSQSDGSYQYRVKACTFSQCSLPRVSNTVVVNTTPPPPPPPNSNRVIFIHTDLLGSPVVETDENGDVL